MASGGRGEGDYCKLKNISATGLFFSGDSGNLRLILSMVLTAGAGAVGTATILEGGSGGAIVCQLAAPANQWSGMEPAKPMAIMDPYVTLGGAGASLTVAY